MTRTNSEMPLVSVCIPAYNNAEYIGDTIHCILNQTWKNLELIVCDDHSSDDTLKVVSSFEDPRIHLYQNEKNLGMSGNWNNALNHCNGDFIKLICADDILKENAIEKEAEVLMNHPQALMAESDTEFCDPEGNVKGAYHRYYRNGLVDGKKIGRACLFTKNWFGAPLNNLFRRSVLKEVHGFDPAFRYILDYDFFMSIACLGKVYIIHEPLNCFRLRNDSNTGEVLSEKQDAYVREHEMLLKKHEKELHITPVDYHLSVQMRKFLNFGAGIYLKMFLKEK